MEQNARRTGDHGIGQMVHVIHVTEDAQALREFYERVLGGFVYSGVDGPDYLDWEDRYATLLMVGDLCIETMAPRLPADPRFSVARFHTKYGRHLHSVGYKVDDLNGLQRRLLDRGIPISSPGGGKLSDVDPEAAYLFPSPRATAGLLIELTSHDMQNDPRLLPTWSSLEGMWRTHPSTLESFSSVVLAVGDLDSAVQTYVDALQAVPLASGSDPELDTDFQVLQLGDCLLEIVQPRSADSDLGRHVATWGNMIYALRFLVRDLDAATSWLEGNGVRTKRIGDDLLVTDPEDSHGAPMFFGTRHASDIRTAPPAAGSPLTTQTKDAQ
ncbi:VOC family protein [Trujillonella endophytica]|uniref:Glyoxalase/Bleomycin resistance protein/Dioxygenase superfamily protein n=1 Tax=Trujillonella endophytica TaxID=673521 RepID=A0A1H8W7D9_9ACTN|nr:VOC family protein [Trujillella endophytica]SEP23453.1 Glyoxalase/Bleomycin resistance protein/Dioxygenase superfamily protein [Trujillella endophytica]